MKRYKLNIAYNGSDFVGWQVQPNGVSIQQVLETTLFKILQFPVHLRGSGRTDAQVHALDQVAHFDAPSIDCSTLLYRLNRLLPRSIKALSLTEVAPNFHAAYSAIKKEYHYHVWTDPIANPFLDPFRYQVYHPLDLNLMRQCAAILTGTHDFTSFCNVHTHVKNKVRTLFRIDLLEQEGGFRLEYEADGFLYKMVRNLTSAILKVGMGKATLHQIQTILEKKDRRYAFAPAPPYALFLVKVTYCTNASKLAKCEEGFLG